MKKFLAIFLSALMMLALFAGCSDKGDDKKDEKKDETSASEKVDNGKEDDKPTAAPGKDVAMWEDEEDGAVMTVTAEYDADTEIVEHFVIEMTVPNTSEEYESISAEYEEVAAMLDAMAPEGFTMEMDDSSDNLIIVMDFAGLVGANKEEMVPFLASMYGIPYDDTDLSIYLDDLDAALVDEGCTRK